MKSEKYYEARIKCEVLNALRKRKLVDKRSILASEYVLGSTGRRADLAIYNGAKFIGVEIKSKYDSLGRLAAQMQVYTSCFDQVILVCDTRHLKHAEAIVQASVEIWESEENGSLNIHRISSEATEKVKSTCVRLLNLGELKSLAGVPPSVPSKKTTLMAEVNQLPDQLVFDAARTSFVQAFSETSASFWERVGRSNISLDCMHHLSRFASERMHTAKKREQQHAFWEQWRDQARAALQSATI